MKNGDFYSLIFRMKYIDRWGLMHSTVKESLSEHSLEVAVLSHALALIGNTKFGKSYRAEHIALAALFHDMNEILTGDLPTPVKYYNEAIRSAYKAIEDSARDKMLSLLDEDLKGEYEKAFVLDEKEKQLIKCADRLCALIKCNEELRLSNSDFASAAESIRASLKTMECPELSYFMEHCLPSFGKTLDQITM